MTDTKPPEITPEIAAKIRAHEEQRAQELGLDRSQMTRFITDPEEIEEQQRKHEARVRWQNASFNMLGLKPLRTLGRLLATTCLFQAQQALAVGEWYPSWLAERVAARNASST